MKYHIKSFLLFLIALSLVSWFWSSDDKKEMVEKKWFKNDNTFVIICRGWPKEGLSGQAKIDSAKEAALINAQFTSRDLFDKSVDVVKNGTIEEVKIFSNYATVRYSISYKNLKQFYKK